MKKVLFVILAIVLVFVVVAALQPADFNVARSIMISAPATDVFSLVNDFNKWNSWSPWANLDPEATYSFEGSASGVGAVFRWAGNQEVGEGSMTMLESLPNESVKIQLDFLKPFESTAITEFALRPDGDQTEVTWSMSGKNNFIGKCIGLVIDCDAMIGDKYEEGLASLKALAETDGKL